MRSAPRMPARTSYVYMPALRWHGRSVRFCVLPVATDAERYAHSSSHVWRLLHVCVRARRACRITSSAVKAEAEHADCRFHVGRPSVDGRPICCTRAHA